MGLPNFSIGGLGDTAVRESRERVRIALRNAGFDFPDRRITVNLAPASLRKAGSGFDLAIALAILAASGQVASTAVDGLAVYAEVGLEGTVRGCRGTLAVAQAAARDGLTALVVSPDRAQEARLVEGLTVVPARTVGDAAAVLCGEADPEEVPDEESRPDDADAPVSLDLADVRGHRAAKGWLRVAAAGGHNLL